MKDKKHIIIQLIFCLILLFQSFNITESESLSSPNNTEDETIYRDAYNLTIFTYVINSSNKDGVANVTIYLDWYSPSNEKDDYGFKGHSIELKSNETGYTTITNLTLDTYGFYAYKLEQVDDPYNPGEFTVKSYEGSNYTIINRSSPNHQIIYIRLYTSIGNDPPGFHEYQFNVLWKQNNTGVPNTDVVEHWGSFRIFGRYTDLKGVCTVTYPMGTLVFHSYIAYYLEYENITKKFTYINKNNLIPPLKDEIIYIDSYDMNISSNDIYFSDDNPLEDQKITINAEIHNSGTYNIKTVNVTFYCDSLNNQIGNTINIFNIKSNSSEVIQTTWTTITGTHKIIVKIDQANIYESNSQNNYAFRYITVNEIPIAKLNLSTNKAFIFENITFYGNKSWDNEKIVEYYFDFDDGNNSGWINTSWINHSYSNDGEYFPRLKVKDNLNLNSNWSTVKLTIIDQLPILSIGSPLNNSVFNHNDTIYFDCFNTTDPYGDIIEFLWASNITGILSTNPQFYTSLPLGNHQITLYVKDGHGHNISEYINIIITPWNRPPIAVITLPSEGAAFNINDSIRFDGSDSYDLDLDILDFYWYSNISGGFGYKSQFTTQLPEGRHLITLHVNDGFYHNVSVSINISVIDPSSTPTGPDDNGPTKPPPTSQDDSFYSTYGLYIGIVLIIIIVIIFGFAAATEVGKYGVLSAMVPLYRRLKKKEVLDNETRGMVRGYILANPGEHYSIIKRTLKLPNGTLTYHLKVLEQEGLVKSKRDGIFKRFFPIEERVPENIMHITKVQELILNEIISTPGITPRELSEKTDKSHQIINYHIKKLISANLIRVERLGKMNKYYPVE